MRSTLLLVAFPALLAGCQTYVADETSPYHVIPAGSQLTLHREIAFRPEQVSVYVQDGRVLTLSQVQRYVPFCKFELYHRRHYARTVSPGPITITKVMQHYLPDAFTRAGRMLPARLPFGLKALMGNGREGGAVLQSYITRMDLRSEQQPDIYRLTCAHWAYSGTDWAHTTADIRRTLEPLFTLRVPAKADRGGA